MKTTWLPPEEYAKSLHRLPSAAGCTILNHENHLLVGKKSYGDLKWTIPGGVLNPSETPRQGAIRETREEVGLEVREVRLLCVHHVIDGSVVPERMQYNFFGGRLSVEEVAGIVLPEDAEWAEFAFLPISEARGRVSDDLAIKLDLLFRAVLEKKVVYIETVDGEIVHADVE